MGCIYKYTNRINNKAYIGYTKRDAEERKKEHLQGAGSKVIKDAIKKYGEDTFIFEVIEDGIIPIPEFLHEREKYWIAKFNTFHNGYNLNKGGYGNLGFSHSTETREKISRSLKGRPSHNKGKPHSPETRRKIGDAQLGKTMPKESRKKMSLSAKNRPPMSNETRRKISEALKGNTAWNKGKTMSDDFRKKASNAQLGKTMSKESRRKISERMSGENHPMFGKNHTAESRAKMSASQKGKSVSQETCRKISNSIRSSPKAKAHLEKLAKRPVSSETRQKMSESHKGKKLSAETRHRMSVIRKHPKKDEVYQCYLDLPSCAPLETRRNYLYEKYPDLHNSTICRWIKEWSPNAKSESDLLYDAWNALPQSFSLKEKRKALREKFPNIHRKRIDRWVRKWQSKTN